MWWWMFERIYRGFSVDHSIIFYRYYILYLTIYMGLSASYLFFCVSVCDKLNVHISKPVLNLHSVSWQQVSSDMVESAKSQISSWQELAADKKRRQQESIPKDWVITLPPSNQLDVTNIPAESGLLSPFELEITETRDVELILAKLVSGEWSSVDVTRAFYKRAIIAQQVVWITRILISV